MVLETREFSHVLSSKSFLHTFEFTSTLKKQQQKKQKMHDCTMHWFATIKQPYPHSVPVINGSLFTGGPSHQNTNIAAPQTKQEWKSLQGPERYQHFGVNVFGTVNGTLRSCLKNQHVRNILKQRKLYNLNDKGKYVWFTSELPFQEHVLLQVEHPMLIQYEFYWPTLHLKGY